MDLLYIARMLLQYGLIFLLTYFVVIISPKIERAYIRAIASGTVLGGELIFIAIIQEQLEWKDISNGRNFFIIFAMIFWGPLATLPVGLAMMVVSLMYPNLYLLQDLLVFSILFIISYSFRRFIHKHSIEIRWQHILGISLIPLLVILPLANVLYQDEIAVQQANRSAWMILLGIAVLNYAIFYASFRESDRRKNLLRIKEANAELEGQNMEIRALYEEMSASEEALQANYIELENYKDKLEYLAYHDSKTGLANGDCLAKELNAINFDALEGKVLIYMRVHGIERLVDTIGQNLIEIMNLIVSKKLTEVLRKHEQICLYLLAQGRYALYVNDSAKIPIEQVLIEVQERLMEIQLIENIYFPVDFDLGAIALETAKDELSLWLEWAEIAMVESSNAIHRNQLVWFTKEMHDKKQYQNRLEFDIQQAIKKQEFYILLQPQFTKSKEMIGAEILLRWEHKEFGLISPQIFIPLAEKIGLINNIGRFVLSEAIEVINKINEISTRELPISINTSMLELLDINFSKQLLAMVKDKGVLSERLNIEITESAIVGDLLSVKNNIEAILSAGIHFHLDDFGTGYSSLSHLSNLPVSHVKVDKSFVDEVLVNERSLQIVKTIVELVHRLDMKVIAEGVEIREQVECLDQLGCDFYQGYYFSKPIPKDKFYRLVSMTEEIRD